MLAYFKLEHALPESTSLAAVLHYGAGVTLTGYVYHVLMTHDKITQTKLALLLVDSDFTKKIFHFTKIEIEMCMSTQITVINRDF